MLLTSFCAVKYLTHLQTDKERISTLLDKICFPFLWSVFTHVTSSHVLAQRESGCIREELVHQHGRPFQRLDACVLGGGWNRGVKSPFSLLSKPISPSSLLFEPISSSSLNVNFSFSPSSLLSPPISPSSQLCLGHFSLLPIVFLPPLLERFFDVNNSQAPHVL